MKGRDHPRSRLFEKCIRPKGCAMTRIRESRVVFDF